MYTKFDLNEENYYTIQENKEKKIKHNNRRLCTDSRCILKFIGSFHLRRK